MSGELAKLVDDDAQEAFKTARALLGPMLAYAGVEKKRLFRERGIAVENVNVQLEGLTILVEEPDRDGPGGLRLGRTHVLTQTPAGG
jgi:hypothetical protein